MRISRLIAGILAAMTIVVSANVLISNAEEVQVMSDEEINNFVFSNVNNMDSVDYYPEFSSYSTGYLSPTPHYMVTLGRKISACTMQFVFAPSAFVPTCTDNSRFSLNYSNLGLNVSQQANSQIRLGVYKYSGSVTGTYGSLTSPMKEFIKYRIYEDSSVVSSDNQLQLFTSASTVGDTTFETNDSSLILYKSIYSVGDVNKDGRINSNDSLMVSKYIAGLLVTDSSRTTDEQECDQLVFELAADVTHDGVIDTADVTLINKAILGIVTLS